MVDLGTLKEFPIEEHINTGPAVTCIACYDSYPLIHDGIKRWTSPLWVLDYTWTQAIPIRVGTDRRPWRPREPRTAHLYPPNTPFWEDFTHARPGLAGANLLFTGGHAAGLGKLIRKGQKYAKLHDTEAKLGMLMNDMAKLPEKYGPQVYPAIQAKLWEIFHLLLTSTTHVKNEDFNIEDTHHIENEKAFSTAVERYMLQHYQEKLTLDSISQELNVSAATLRKKFRLEQKVSPMVRLNEIRIEIAKNRLLRGEKLCDIATQIGFYDEFHLSKSFKKVTGQSPREYLKRIHEELA